MHRSMSARLLAEFVGPLALVFVGAGSIVAASTIGAEGGAGLVTIAIAHGLVIATMVSATGHISGGHINPAVTIGLLSAGKIKLQDAFGYIVAQLAGGVAGALLLRAALPETVWRQAKLGATLVTPGISDGKAVLIEAVLTFFLVWVVMATAVDSEGAFNKIAGLAIGFVILMDIMMGGPFTGASMNPARTFGPAVAGGYWDTHWVYWIGPAAGGVIAAVLYDSLVLRTREGHGVGAHGGEV